MDRAKVIRLAMEAMCAPVEITTNTPVIYPVTESLVKFAALIQQSLIDDGWRSPEDVDGLNAAADSLQQDVYTLLDRSENET